MLTLPVETRRLATELSAVAGFVDAVAFLSLGGYFVSFMSGNSTRMATAVWLGSPTALVACAIIVSFVTGVAIGTRTAAFAQTRAKSMVLVVVSAILFAATLAGLANLPLASALMAATAMGASNAVIMREGGMPVGITYMTGTLVKLGQELGARTPSKRALRAFAVHWAALVVGAVVGAAFETRFNLSSLSIASVATGLLAWRESRRQTGLL
jgi:uncharacterized membrane protein YoaK (UPF0700 family)